MNFNYNDVLCYGDSNGIVELSPSSGQSPFNFVFDGYIYNDSIFDNLQVGNYQFYIKDSNNCNSDTVSININQPDSLVITFQTTPESDSGYLDGEAFAIVNGGTYPFTYSWDHLPNLNDSLVIYLSNGYYPITVTDFNGCSILDSAFIGLLTNVHENNNNIFKIYPNPSLGTVFLDNISNNFSSLKVFDISGKLVKDEVRVSPNEMLELNLLKGQYFIELTQNRFRTVKKIVILE
tara:strand:- start:2032 stop:2736 length:705 start_codon:yes stop_codon:yes gene_type:complete